MRWNSKSISYTIGSAWRLEVGIPDDTNGTLRISIPNNVVSVGNDAESEEFVYNRAIVIGEPLPVSIDTNAKANSTDNTNSPLTDGNITGAGFYAHITFGTGIETARVSGFSRDDITVTNACKGDLTSYGTFWARIPSLHRYIR